MSTSSKNNSGNTPNFDSHDEVLDSTSSKEKIWVYLRGLSEEPNFQKKIRDIRKKYLIPDNGLEEILYVYSDSSKQDIMKLPPKLGNEDSYELVEEWLKELGLGFFWSEAILYYIAYNKWFNFWSFGGLVQVEDLNQYMNGPFQYEGEEQGGIDYIKKISEEYPVAVSISSYASQRDIIDFIKKTYNTHIKPLQERYKDPDVRIGKIRKRNLRVLERNEFIYANKDSSAKEIASMVAEKFGDILDYTYISKIITDEKMKGK